MLLRQIRPQVNCSCREVLSLLSRLLQEPGGDRVNLQSENLLLICLVCESRLQRDIVRQTMHGVSPEALLWSQPPSDKPHPKRTILLPWQYLAGQFRFVSWANWIKEPPPTQGCWLYTA